jgi:hypothetical protein
VYSYSTAKDEGRVLAFGRRGDIKWEYKGGNVKLEVPFDPDDIVSTGLIVVTDERLCIIKTTFCLDTFGAKFINKNN